MLIYVPTRYAAILKTAKVNYLIWSFKGQIEKAQWLLVYGTLQIILAYAKSVPRIEKFPKDRAQHSAYREGGEAPPRVPAVGQLFGFSFS